MLKSETENHPDTDRVSILLIDDDPDIYKLVAYYLEGSVDNFYYAFTPDEGIRIAIEKKPDVILLDIGMPDKNGFQVCRELKDDESTRDLLIIFLTAENDTTQIVKALDSGGVDYITKPFQPIELQARIRAALRTRRLIRLLHEHSRIDSLTGLHNRGAFDSALSAALSSHERNHQPFALLLLDLDHFKFVNDRYGHGVGDEVLRRVGKALASASRPYDFAARYGGEEFAVILNQVKPENAKQASLRILAQIRAIEVPLGESTLRITASAGMSCVPDSTAHLDPKTMLKIADKALYEAKNQGRDRLVDCIP